MSISPFSLLSAILLHGFGSSQSTSFLSFPSESCAREHKNSGWRKVDYHNMKI